MPIIPKNWQDDESGNTPISAAALIDLEARMGAYADSTGGPATVITGGSISGAFSLDLLNNPFVQFPCTLVGNVVLTLSNMPAGGWLVIESAQDATGGRTLIINSTSVPLDTAPLANNAVLVFTTDGTTYWITGQRGPVGPTGPQGPPGVGVVGGASLYVQSDPPSAPANGDLWVTWL